MAKVLVIGDCHFPFGNKQTLNKIIAFALENQPDIIVQVGDLYDFFSFSRFPRSHNVMTPNEELTEGRRFAEWMWKSLLLAYPLAKCYQLRGNHCARPLKRIHEIAPEMEMFVRDGVNGLFKFDNVTSSETDRDILEINDVLYIHGFKSKLGDHMKFMRRNVVCGHTHKGGVVYENTFQGKILWELNAGFCADPKAEAMQYTPIKFTLWTQGFGWVDSNGCRFISL
jgi:predicted phosphodiesterase